MKRTYKLDTSHPGKDHVIVEIDLDDDGRETGSQPFLSLYPGTVSETQFDVVIALQRVYQKGRDDYAREQRAD